METIRQILKVEFNADLSSDFSRCAYFEPVMDYVEYTAADEITVSDRVDEFLTLLYLADSTEVIGFRLKGFRHAFDKLKNVLQLREEHFLPLTRVIENMFSELGEDICKDQEKLNSYRAALRLAEQDSVTFNGAMLLAA